MRRSGALRILACHHPLIEMIGAPMTGEVKRGDKAALIFAEAGVDLITTGHVHVPFALGIDLSDRCSYAIGCGTLSHRERGAPPSFNRIDWDCARDRGDGGGLDRAEVRGSSDLAPAASSGHAPGRNGARSRHAGPDGSL